MKVKPVVPGAVIRDPITKVPLPADGGDVPENNYWVRRLLAGEVVRVAEPAAVTEPAADPTGREPVAPLTTRS